MTSDQAQKLVGLSALALIVIGPLSMILPVFFYSPLDGSSWWRSLGVGLLFGVLPLIGLLVLERRRLLDLPQVVLGGAFIVLGLATLISAWSLLLNGLLDGSELKTHAAQVENFWLDCSKHKPQNSTTTITTCRHYGSFSFPGGERAPIEKIELADEMQLEVGELIEVSWRQGAFGWAWGLEPSLAP